MFPAFLDLAADELHLEMASRELAEIELIGTIAERQDVAVGVIDVKSYYVETPEDVEERIRRVPALRARRAAFGRSRLRAVADRALGRAGEARAYGRGRTPDSRKVRPS